MQSGAGHGEVGPGGEHQHLGSPHGKHSAVAATAGQHPNQQTDFQRYDPHGPARQPAAQDHGQLLRWEGPSLFGTGVSRAGSAH